MEKIKFNDVRETVEVTLPSQKGSKVKMYKALTVGEQTDILKQFPDIGKGGGQAMDGSISMVVKAIIEWNIDIDVTIENIKKMSTDDLLVMTEVITPDEKKS